MRQLYLVVLFICLQGNLARAQSTFLDVTSPAGLLPISGCDAVAVADFNQDGYDDFYINFSSSKNLLYKNMGDGTFSEIGESAGVAVSTLSAAAVWGDINNDGWPDLYVARTGSPDQLFLNNRDETFTNISLQAGINQMGHPFSVNMADMNKDGFLDIYVANFLSENVLYRNNGNNTFSNVTFLARPLDSGKSMGSIFFDYDQDGDLDLYLVHDSNEPNFLYQNDGTGIFTEIGQAAGVNTQSLGMGVDAGDVNNDGWPDLYITNLYENVLLLNNGDGTFSDISESAGVDDYGMGWGCSFLDFDNDGWQDIYAVNDYAFSAYPNLLYRNLGDGTFEKTDSAGVISNLHDSYGTACLDFNLDGKPDIVVANRSNGESLQLFQNNASSGSWIGLKLLGTTSNRGAIGARVRILDAAGVVHYRECTAGHGWKSQNSGTLIFGLGASDSIQMITVFWPSGLEQAIDPVSLNKYYTIVEGSAPVPGLLAGSTTAVEQLSEPQALRFGVYPNPANAGDRLVFYVDVPVLLPVRLRAFDTRGKLLGETWRTPVQTGKNAFEMAVSELVPSGFSGMLHISGMQGHTSSMVKVLIR
ncbi:MAG: CRTAC1 family protein [Bacteroidetes bacterium]|nr:MAG: CRTAC1 family protein [Bacteroidota bacterium]